MADKILTHFIAGYPTLEESLDIAKGLIEGGACALEVQFPYSDPTADGPVIESACRLSLEKGFRIDDGFRLVKTLKALTGIPVYIMSYGGIVFNRGVERFVREAKESGADGLIIPDLTPGNDEGLYEAGKKYGIMIIPVIVPTVGESRINEILKTEPEWIYIALRSGITGSRTEIGPEQTAFTEKVRSKGVKVMAGFGIQERDQVVAIREHCDAAIVGSQIIRTIDAALAGGIPPGQAVKKKVESLKG